MAGKYKLYSTCVNSPITITYIQRKSIILFVFWTQLLSLYMMSLSIRRRVKPFLTNSIPLNTGHYFIFPSAKHFLRAYIHKWQCFRNAHLEVEGKQLFQIKHLTMRKSTCCMSMDVTHVSLIGSWASCGARHLVHYLHLTSWHYVFLPSCVDWGISYDFG